MRSREPAAGSGYNLAGMIVIVAVMGVLIGAALPVIEHQRRRAVEEEVLFRGMQYAEAIRVFQLRQGRPPTRLEELLETEPRSIRQLWDNPMEGGSWGMVRGSGTPAVEGAGPSLSSGSDDGRSSGFGVADDDEDLEEDGPGLRSLSGRETSTGPVLGVYPRGRGAPIRSFLGGDSYKEWQFTAEVVPQPALSLDGGFVSRANAAFAGRPFLYNLVGPGLQAIETDGLEQVGDPGSVELFDQGGTPDAFGSRFESTGGTDDDEDEEDDT